MLIVLLELWLWHVLLALVLLRQGWLFYLNCLSVWLRLHYELAKSLQNHDDHDDDQDDHDDNKDYHDDDQNDHDDDQDYHDDDQDDQSNDDNDQG